jgi:hypothetical protein
MPSIGTAHRHTPNLHHRTGGATGYKQWLTFDAWTHGEKATDTQLGTPDSRWFRIKGTNTWVPSGYIFGNPEGLPGGGGGGGGGNVDNGGPITNLEQYMQRLYGGSPGSFGRGYIPGHLAIDTTHRGAAPHKVYSLTGGTVKYIGTDWNGGKYVTVWNEELQRTFLYLHFNSFNPNLKVGQKISAGHYLGNEGWTGYTIPSGPGGRHTHVHVTRSNGTREHPITALSRLSSGNSGGSNDSDGGNSGGGNSGGDNSGGDNSGGSTDLSFSHSASKPVKVYAGPYLIEGDVEGKLSGKFVYEGSGGSSQSINVSLNDAKAELERSLKAGPVSLKVSGQNLTLSFGNDSLQLGSTGMMGNVFTGTLNLQAGISVSRVITQNPRVKFEGSLEGNLDARYHMSLAGKSAVEKVSVFVNTVLKSGENVEQAIQVFLEKSADVVEWLGDFISKYGGILAIAAVVILVAITALTPVPGDEAAAIGLLLTLLERAKAF